MKYLMLMLMFLLYNKKVDNQHHFSRETIDKIFMLWNEKTIGSINSQLLVADNSNIKSYLQNTKDILKQTLYSPTVDDKGVANKGKPSRFKLLQTIFADRRIGKNFFVIETKEEGEVTLPINCVVENNANTTHLLFYTYYNHGWTKASDTTIAKVDLHSELMVLNDRNKTRSGNNQSDVILSEFNSFDITSRYYVYSTITRDNAISKILGIYFKHYLR